MKSTDLIVIKLGGSLLNLPNLEPRLFHFLKPDSDKRIILVVGGGNLADVIRRVDEKADLGNAAHWMSIAAMACNSRSLADSSTFLEWSEHVEEAVSAEAGQPIMLDPWNFMLDDEKSENRLPHSWAVTSDSIAARVAQVTHANELVLLKSATPSTGATWAELANFGFVDKWFPIVADLLPNVRVINFLAETSERVP